MPVWFFLRYVTCWQNPVSLVDSIDHFCLLHVEPWAACRGKDPSLSSQTVWSSRLYQKRVPGVGTERHQQKEAWSVGNGTTVLPEGCSDCHHHNRFVELLAGLT